jgi:ferrochelatase
VKIGRVGVLIVNLGTPEGTDRRSVRRYLAEFLTDRRVIETSRLVWYPVLYGIILNTRPARKGRDYARIWNTERDESPLRTITRAQGEALAARLAGHPELRVDWAMRYGKPSIAERLSALEAEGCDRILVLPLYPQYAAATTATVNDKVFEHLLAERWQPALRTVPPYYDEPAYIEAVAGSIESHIAGLGWQPEVVLASFHGIPQSYFRKGDPYYCHCAKTVRLLEERLGWDKGRLRMTFQSRFGPEEWLQPYTDGTLRALAGEGVRDVAVVTPGFAADCLETIEEIGVENAEIFRQAGGRNFARIPCLNDSPAGLDVIEAVVRRELRGWVAGI